MSELDNCSAASIDAVMTTHVQLDCWTGADVCWRENGAEEVVITPRIVS
jgi:hypothetical protein